MYLRQGPAGRTAYGAWIKLPGIESSEIFAAAGFDFCVVDMEHTMLDLAAVEHHIVVGKSHGMRVFVRVPDTGAGRIQRLLDGSADGIIVPHVDDAATAARLVAGSHFPPLGTRGSGGTSRAGGFGLRERGEYLSSGGGIVAQIESVEATRSIESITQVRGLDAVMLGPADLNLDPRRDELGSNDEVSAAIVAAARSNNVAVGTACSPAQAVLLRDDFDFVVCANDTTLLAAAAHEVVRALHTRKESLDVSSK